jgi:hypothetical protein
MLGRSKVKTIFFKYYVYQNQMFLLPIWVSKGQLSIYGYATGIVDDKLRPQILSVDTTVNAHISFQYY